MRIIFDPKALTYRDLLARYEAWHPSPYRDGGQYRSALFPSDEAQLREVAEYLARQAGAVPNVYTPGTAASRFWDAEDYHQKYRLRRRRSFIAELEKELGPRWDQHTVATKLNAAREPGIEPTDWLASLSPGTIRAWSARG